VNNLFPLLEPQISTVVTVDASFEVLDWMELLVKEHHHDMETSLSENLKAVIHRYLKNKDHALQSKNMLMLNDASSKLVSLNEVFLNRMFEIRQGTNGSRSSEWKMVVMDQQDEHPVDVINGWFTNHELVSGKH
jgi:hypothetical protein